MSTHPEIHHLAKEERIRAIAYSLWEEEGRPGGCSEQHWFRATELVAAEAEPSLETISEQPAEVVEPDWLKRDPALAEDTSAQQEKTQSLDQLAKRISAMRAA